MFQGIERSGMTKLPFDYQLKLAFQRLAKFVSNQDQAWIGELSEKQLSEKQLLHRIAALAWSLGVLPANHAAPLGAVVGHWESANIWESEPSLSQLRAHTRAFLRSFTAATNREPISSPSLTTNPYCVSWCLDVSARPDLTSNQLDVATALLDKWLSCLHSQRRWTHLPPAVPGDRAVPIDRGFIRRTATIDDQFERGNMSITFPELLDATLHELVVIGEAKSGKSSLIQWLAFQAANGNLEHYDQPIVVDLAAYASAIAKRPSISLLEFFCATLDCPSHELRDACAGLRTLARSSERFLLLLDRWNEVPKHQRAFVRERITNASDEFTTLIATQPSGMPESLVDGSKTTLCWLDELSSDVAFDVVTKSVINRYATSVESATESALDIHSQYREFTQDPYWLLQTVSAYANGVDGELPFHQTRLISQLVRWIRQFSDDATESHNLVKLQHLDALATLANRMVFDSQRPRRTFFSEEFERIAINFGCHHAPLLASRLVCPVNSVIDSYAFRIAAIRDYFAACHWVTLSSDECADGAVAQQQFDAAMQSVERFPVLIHAVRIAGTSSLKWRDHASRWLKRTDEATTVLVRLAKLFQVAEYYDQDNDPLVISLRQKIQRATQRPHACNLQRQLRVAAESLSERASEDAQYTADRSVLAMRCRTASRTGTSEFDRLQNSSSNYIDRQVAIDVSSVCPDSKRFSSALARLNAHQVFSLSDVLIDIACDGHVSVQTRRSCLFRLAEFGNPLTVSNRARSIISLQDPLLLEQVLNLVDRQDMGRVFESMIASVQQISPRLKSSALIPSALSAIRQRASSLGSPLRSFVCQEICRILQCDDLGEVTSLDQSLRSLTNRERRTLLDDAVQSTVVAMWNDLINPCLSLSLEHLRLAALLMQALPAEVRQTRFAQAIRRLVSREEAKDSCGNQADCSGVKQMLEVLVEHALENDSVMLMELAYEHFAVKELFCQLLFHRRWIWMDDRLFDDAGQLLAIWTDGPQRPHSLSTPEAVQEIAVALPKRQRSDFLSYWYMVSEGDEAYRANDREKIYQDLCLLLDSSVSTSLGEKLASCYDDGQPPAFATWRKNLSRVVQRCDSNPQWSAYLHEIGLGIQRRMPR